MDLVIREYITIINSYKPVVHVSVGFAPRVRDHVIVLIEISCDMGIIWLWRLIYIKVKNKVALFPAHLAQLKRYLLFQQLIP